MRPNKKQLNNSVLIVDDDIEALEEMADALRDYGLSVYSASSAMALKLANKHRPEFIVMDYLLPHFSGVETIKAIRTTLPDTQVIIISAFEGLSRIAKTINSGAVAVLREPLSMESIGCFIKNKIVHKTLTSRQLT
ncbi:MAG: two-component system OmpR family response regulator [Candidatus Pseudothioglobus sp.]|jgi:DNA-binding NtrC family response regulator